jgi:hypothetical protein
MKRNLTLFSIFLVLCTAKLSAQTYTGITLTGFTHDVVAEATPAANTTGSVTIDAAGYVLYSALYTNTTTAGGLKATGVYTTSTRTYSLASYAGKNTLRVTTNSTDSLTLTNPASYSGISILGFSSGVDALTDVMLRFSDGTSAAYTSRTLYNWSSSQPAIIQGFGKTNRATDAPYFTPTEPKMFSIDIPVICANQTKTITRIVVKNKTIGSTVFLFAAAGIGKSDFVANSVPVTCKGTASGTAKALGVDAYGPLSYTWMPGGQNTQTATNLIAGNYTVTVADGNNCSYTRTVAVTEAASTFSIVSIGASSVICGSASTASAQVSVTGGNTPYIYTWTGMSPATTAATSNSLSGLPAGDYSVTVQDNNGCVLTATTTVAKPNVVISVSTSSLLCGSTANGSATVTSVTGTTGPFTYSWTPAAQSGSVATALSAQTYTVRVTDNASCTISQTLSIGAPSISITSSNATCTSATGSATVTVNGGAGAPYTYTWMPSAQTTSVATGLSPGNYTVTVRDNANCPITKTLSVGANQPTLTVATNSLLCGTLANGSATVTAVTGATGPFSYTWTPSAQTGSVAINLGAGVYSVIVSGAGGCTKTQTLSIDKPTLSVSTSPTACKGTQPTGSATVTAVNGGTAPFTYSWDSGTMSNIASGPSASGLDEGTYVVNVTDANNCITSANLTIISTAPSALFAITTVTNATCSGINNGKASVSASGGVMPYSYSWNTNPPQYTANATGLPSPNTFVVSVIDFNGCLLGKSVVIYPAPVGLIMNASPSTTICPGTSATLSINGLSAPGTYTWSTGATATTSVSVSPTATLTVYSVTATASSGCKASGSLTVFTATNAAENCPTSLKEEAFVSYNLYPNPNTGEFTIAFNHTQNNATIEVMDALGKLVLTQNVSGMEATVNTITLQNGIYFVTVRDEKNILVRTKVIKQ